MTGWSNFLTGKLRRPQVMGLIAIIVVAAASIYGIGAFKRNAGDAVCRPALARAQQLASLTGWELSAIRRKMNLGDGPAPQANPAAWWERLWRK